MFYVWKIIWLGELLRFLFFVTILDFGLTGCQGYRFRSRDEWQRFGLLLLASAFAFWLFKLNSLI
jgi:hypothetical protein